MTQHHTRLAAAAILTLAVAPATSHAATIAGSGSSASVPYVEALYAAYKKVDKKNTFTFNANNGNAGAKDVQEGRSQFAIQTRPPQASDSGLQYGKLFLDALTISVHPSNKLNNLTVKEVKSIYTGTVTEWSAFPSAGLSSPIQPFGRVSTAGLYTYFASAVLEGASPASNVTPVDKDGEVAVALSKNPNGIGYIGLANSKPANGVKRLTLNGVAATPKNIKRLKYPLSRFAWIVLPANNPNRAAARFADWVRTSYAAGKVLEKAGAVPVWNSTKKPKKK